MSTPLPFWTCIIVGKKKWWPRSLLLKIIWLYFINALNPLYLQEQCIVHPHTTHFEDNHFSRHRSYLHQKEKSIKLVHIKGSIRDPIRDGWIKEFIKRKFWAVGAAEKKTLPTAISMQLFGVVFSTFGGQKNQIIYQKYCSVCSWV